MGRGPEQTRLPGRHTNGLQLYEKMFSFTIRKMQIKTTMRYYLNKTSNHRCRRGCGEKGTLTPCWWERRWSNDHGKQCGAPQKLNHRVTYDPAIPLLCAYQRNSETFYYRKDPCPFCAHYRVIHGGQDGETTKVCPSKDDWIQKTWFTHTRRNTARP